MPQMGTFSAQETCDRPDLPSLRHSDTPDGQENLGMPLYRRRNLHSDQNPPVIGTMVAIMEQTDVPAATHAVQELHQSPGTLRKLETVKNLVFRRRCVSSDQMPDVNLGHFIVRQ